jgi:hypothetical protein
MNKDKRTQVPTRSAKIQSGSQRGKGTNYVAEPSPVTGSISEGNGRKPKSVVSL